MQKDLNAALFAGLLSGGLFLITTGLGLGFLFLFLPTLPLLSLGLSRTQAPTLIASFIATVIISLATTPAAGILFLIFLGFPSWYIAHLALLWRPGDSPDDKHWFPAGLIFLRLTLYGCTIMALIVLYFSLQEQNMPELLAQNIHDTFADLGDEYNDIVDTLAHQWAFFIFSITIWLWGLALYAHGWIANRMLVRKSTQLRPDFSMQPFIMPNWMLPLLAICALGSLIGGESMRFLGKACLISLMLPYFFSGAALMHASSKTWPNQRILLFFIYLIIAAQFWPALILSAIGFWHHIKRLSSATSSSKN